jgi:hypothetical protein
VPRAHCCTVVGCTGHVGDVAAARDHGPAHPGRAARECLGVRHGRPLHRDHRRPAVGRPNWSWSC